MTYGMNYGPAQPYGSSPGYGLGMWPQPSVSRGPSPKELAKMESQENMAEAMRYTSDNNKAVALGQIQGTEFALEQASLDREMQLAANLELGIEKLDTSLSLSKMEYIQQMSAEENRHVETMAGMSAISAGRSDSPSSGSGDFPMPEEV